MPGKLCMGNNNVPNDAALSRAYCLGRSDRLHGGGTAEENYNNPHPVHEHAAHNAYNRGANSAVLSPDNIYERDCCADVPSSRADLVVPDVVGISPGQANFALLSAGFNPKPENTLTGNVVSQDPVGGTPTQSGSDVTYVAS